MPVFQVVAEASFVYEKQCMPWYYLVNVEHAFLAFMYIYMFMFMLYIYIYIIIYIHILGNNHHHCGEWVVMYWSGNCLHWLSPFDMSHEVEYRDKDRICHGLILGLVNQRWRPGWFSFLAIPAKTKMKLYTTVNGAPRFARSCNDKQSMLLGPRHC